MRVLWIAPNGGDYNNNVLKGTGGWIGALQEELLKRNSDLELGIVFQDYDDNPKYGERVTYFPIKISGKSKIQKALNLIFVSEQKREIMLIEGIKRSINQFKPDLIHVWGIENTYAAAIPYINCPYLVHIQGLLSISIYAYCPPGFSVNDIKRIDPWWKPVTYVRKLLHITNYCVYKNALYRAEREIRVSKYVKNWIGRTDWDFTASRILSPKSNYFHCDELLRKNFTESKWQFHYASGKIRIHSTISPELYKGIDIVLKTADVLRKRGKDIEWNIYGLSKNDKLLNFFSKHFSINPEEVGIVCHGMVGVEQLLSGLLKCDCFVHPSYMENSSNAIAEAMLLGVPTIAQYIGGNPTMLNDNSGILVSSNDPYILANKIVSMTDKNIANQYSIRAYTIGRNRHSTKDIICKLLSAYKVTLDNSKS